MRSLEYLIQLYPDKTGAEILAIQAEDKANDADAFQRLNNDKLDFINDINSNGGYFKGKFGSEQHYFYRVFDAILNPDGNVTISVESIVMFVGSDISGRVSIERRTKDYQQLDTYGLEAETRVTVKEWDEINYYLNYMLTKFW